MHHYGKRHYANLKPTSSAAFIRRDTQASSYFEAADEVSRLSTGESYTLMGNFSGSTVAIFQIVDGLLLTHLTVLPSSPSAE